jgi:hypothetical protein
MDLSLPQFIRTLRRAGLPDVASAAIQTLPNPVDSKMLDRFCAEHGLTRESLVERMGGSP